MGQRLDFQTLLEGLTRHVFFQPPTRDRMPYPCIVYEWDDEVTKHADNRAYNSMRRYKVTIIDRDPDSTIPAAVAALPMSTFDRFFPADGLNHTVYNVYF